MTDTMTSMELIKVDSMTAYSLEPGDLIDVDGDVVTVKNIVALNDGYEMEIVNDFGEEDIIYPSDDQLFDVYIDDQVGRGPVPNVRIKKPQTDPQNLLFCDIFAKLIT